MALGALPAGLLAAYLPWPPRLSYVIYLSVLCVIAAAVAYTPETVSRPVRSAKELSLRPRLAAGAVVALSSLLGAIAGMATRKLSSRTAMLAGSALLLPGIALLPCAQGLHSLALLLCGTVVTAAATMLAYRGSLEGVNQLAPGERRAEVISSYILCMYAGILCQSSASGCSQVPRGH